MFISTFLDNRLIEILNSRGFHNFPINSPFHRKSYLWIRTDFGIHDLEYVICIMNVFQGGREEQATIGAGAKVKMNSQRQ